jgi:drug/metabolite transporter (DMT)-like permease
MLTTIPSRAYGTETRNQILFSVLASATAFLARQAHQLSRIFAIRSFVSGLMMLADCQNERAAVGERQPCERVPARASGRKGDGRHQSGKFQVARLGFALLWVWILSFTPLSRAYPFVALAFALTPLLAGSLFGETISLRLITGLLFIICGLFFVTA